MSKIFQNFAMKACKECKQELKDWEVYLQYISLTCCRMDHWIKKDFNVVTSMSDPPLANLVTYQLETQARSVLQDLGLDILQCEKHIRLINSKYTTPM